VKLSWLCRAPLWRKGREAPFGGQVVRFEMRPKGQDGPRLPEKLLEAVRSEAKR
jgi:hypothetical protein